MQMQAYFREDNINNNNKKRVKTDKLGRRV